MVKHEVDQGGRGRRRLRRLLGGLAILVLFSIVAVAALPWALGTPPARRWLVAQVNDRLKPARVELDSVRLGWFGPIRLTGLDVVDGEGHRMLSVPSATTDRGLFQILVQMPNYGTITLEGAALDVERRADGTIDLVEALDPIIGSDDDPDEPSDPLTDATLVVVGGSLRLRSPELAEPLVAESMEMTVRVPAAPALLTCDIHLERPGDERLRIEGAYDWRATAGAPTDLTLKLTGARWPLAAGASGVVARGRLDGEVGLRLESGGMAVSGDARVLELDASGPTLAGDRLQLARVDGNWNLAQGAEGNWSIRKLDLDSPLVTLSATTPEGRPLTESIRVDGRLDLAALARQLPHRLHIREGLVVERGEARIEAALSPEGEGQRLTAKAKVSDLLARDAGRAIALAEPATLEADLVRTGSDIRVDRLELRAASLEATGSGDLDAGVRLTASVDLAALQAQISDLVDFGGVSLAGRGRLAADYRRTGPTYAARLGAEFRDLRVAGLTTEPLLREAVALQAAADGPVDDSGLPASWESARLGLRADDIAAQVAATDREGHLAIEATATGPVAYSGRTGKGEVRVVARQSERAWDLDEIRIGLLPDDPAHATSGAIALAARGRWDEAAGTLALAPLAGATSTPIGLAADGLRVSGLGQDATALQVEGGLAGDLGALDHALAAWLDSGQGLEGPFAVALRGSYETEAERLRIDDLRANLAYGSFAMAGTVDEPGGRRLADLSARLEPNWERVDAWLAGAVEPGARLKATVRPIRVRGPLSGGSGAEILRGLDAELGLELAEAEAYGVRVGPTPIVLHCRDGQAAFDPIQTTVNNGRADLRADLQLDDPAGLALRLAPGSSIHNAEIDERVSHDVLVLIAPVLDRATQVSGQVSVDIRHAVVPLENTDARTMALDGQIVFQDVAFGPGPFAAQLLALAGPGRPQAIRLNQPLELAIADSRVHQRGLSVPIGSEAQIELEGSVGFDRTLALRAGVPITAAMLGGQEILQEIVGGTRVGVPIGGTVMRPVLDRQAMAQGMREASRSLVKRGAARGAAELMNRIGLPEGLAAPGQAGQAPAGRLDPLKLLDSLGRGRRQAAPGTRRE